MEQIIKRVNVSELRDNLAKALRKVEHAGLCYIVRRHGRPVAVLMSIAAARYFWDMQLDQKSTKVAGDGTDAQAEGPPEPRGYFRRLLNRRAARQRARVARATDEAAADKRAYETFRGLDDGV